MIDLFTVEFWSFLIPAPLCDLTLAVFNLQRGQAQPNDSINPLLYSCNVRNLRTPAVCAPRPCSLEQKAAAAIATNTHVCVCLSRRQRQKMKRKRSRAPKGHDEGHRTVVTVWK